MPPAPMTKGDRRPPFLALRHRRFAGAQLHHEHLDAPRDRPRHSDSMETAVACLAPQGRDCADRLVRRHAVPVLKPSAPSLPPEMLRTLLVSMAVFTVLYVGLVTLRYGLGMAEDARDEATDAG